MNPFTRLHAPGLAAALILVAGLACGTGRIVGGGSGAAEDDSGPAPNPGDGDAGAACGCSSCAEKSIGIGTPVPFNIVSDPSEFVATDGDGALVLDKRNTTFNQFLWVADTNLPGVVKIDLDTFQIVGRYVTGGGSTSRTTVNARGEAFVGARTAGPNGGPGVTKVLPQGQDCPDTNGDGEIRTSTGVDDVLPWGEDDCVAWHTETEGDIRGLAAQDSSGAPAPDACSGGDDTSVEHADEHYVWVGGLHGKIYKLDADTGEILLNITAPSGVYGAALSGDGKLWTTGGGLAFLDTTKCTDQATCDAAPTCMEDCGIPGGGEDEWGGGGVDQCSDTCDDAVKATYPGLYGYGITVDCAYRVWLSAGPTTRYDPYLPVAERIARGPESGGGGIAADASGWVWACYGSSTVRIDADTLEGVQVMAPCKGVAVDSVGRVLSIQNTGVHLTEPGLTLQAYELTNDVTALPGFAYAYSDMTGVQTRLAAGGPGWYRHVFEGCAEDADTTWHTLQWDLDAPDGTWAMFYVRSADTIAGLDSAEWQLVATCVTGAGCSDAGPITDQTGRLIEVEVRLPPTRGGGGASGGCFDDQAGSSVRIRRFGVKYNCAGTIG